MKYLIVGLGNMDPEYFHTRHNIGFEVVDALADKAGVSWKIANLGMVTEMKHRGRKLLLLKPSTYMNRSGKAVRYWMQQEKIPLQRVLVIVDDLNLPFGTLRLRAKGSDGGHNGLKDIQEVLGQTNYPRLRLGIGDNFNKGRQVDYVLGKWSESEKKQLSDFLDKAADAVKSFASIGLGHTMSQFNG